MTKISVSPEYQKGLSRKADIEALKSAKRESPPSRKPPAWATEAFNLLVAGCIGGACTWVAIRFML